MTNTVQGDRLLLAIGARLVAALSLTSMNAIVKLAEARGAGVGELLFFRQATIVPVLATCLALGPGLGVLRTGRIGAHALRAASGLTGLAFLFFTVSLLPLAEATTLTFTAPLFATLLGALVLGEPTGWHRWSAVALGFAGVTIVVHPGAGHFAPLGTALGLLYALMTAIVSIQLRRIGRTEHPLATVFWFGALSLPVCAIAMALSWRPHPVEVWVMMVAVGLIGALTQICLTASLRLGPVSVVVPMDYSGLIWATLYGFALFGVLPDWTTWLGAPLIVASGIYIVLRESRLKRVKTESAGAEV
ncbi:MAG: DMT family transporter [Sphingomonas sp.]|uniref:DMT family transporter n=1 Tax=Sphingomonas sp. TaxID=28214 RepID=UPI001AC833D4|nr:DMT family transporter [Sphingomonas sp.]MBN8808544.1 DMT family transporter [Sphingomonas sp.]